MGDNQKLIWGMIVGYLLRFGFLPRPEFLKDDLDRPNKRVHLDKIVAEFDELVEWGYLSGPGKYTGGYQLTEKGWKRVEGSGIVVKV